MIDVWSHWLRSRLLESLFRLSVMLCAAGALGIVGFVILISVQQGLDRFSWEFFFAPSRNGGIAGGILYQIVGTGLLIVSAGVIATPFACGIAVLQTVTRNQRLASLVRSTLHILNATPSIMFGLLGFLFFVKVCDWDKSWLAGGFILALMILPTVTLSLMNRIATIPQPYTETALALGLTEDQMIRSIYLPYGYGGLLTGLVMGLARAMGETAPIMFTAVVFAGATIPSGIKDSPVLALPYHIFNLAQDVAADSALAGAWATASVLIGLVLLLSLVAAPFRARSHEEASVK